MKIKGRIYEDTKELRVMDDDSFLKVFRLSEPPYNEGKTFAEPGSYTAHLDYEDGGGCNASRFGVLLAICLALMLCFNRVTKLRKRSDNRWHVFWCHLSRGILLLCIAAVVGAMLYYPSLHNHYFTEASAPSVMTSRIIICLTLGYKPAAQEYFYEHSKTPGYQDISSSLSPYLDEYWRYVHNRYASGDIVLMITSDTAWVGYNLTKSYPVEPWWKAFLEGRALNLEVREKLAKKASEFSIYGSENITAPPASSDVNSLYKKKDNVAWLRVD